MQQNTDLGNTQNTTTSIPAPEIAPVPPIYSHGGSLEGVTAAIIALSALALLLKRG